MTRVKLAIPNAALSGGDDEGFSSPLLREVLAQFDSATRHVILVPGAGNPGMLSLLEGKRCRLLVADAAQALSELSEGEEDAARLSDPMAQLIFGAGTEKIDLVLCWDLLNYLSPPLLKAFARRLTAIISPGGTLHAYIHSASSTMPQHPQRYSLDGDGRVVRVSQDPAVRKTPRYSYGDLEKHLSGFRVLRSMLLRNGIQEYVLRLEQA